MSAALKTSSQKRAARLTWGRYILIVCAALILAILLYLALQLSNVLGGLETAGDAIPEPAKAASTGVQPASFQEVSEFTEGALQRLRLSGLAQPGAVVVITNRGERLRQVAVSDVGQWGVTLDVEPGPMVLEAQVYMGEDLPGIRSEQTIFRLPVPETETEGAPEDAQETVSALVANYKTPALIMVTAPGSPSRVLQSPFGGTPTSGPLSLSAIDYDFAGGIIITGTSSMPGRVRFYAQNSVIGETGIGVGGRWNFIAGNMLPRARIMLRAELIPSPGASEAAADEFSISLPFNFLPPLQEEDTDGSGALSVNAEPLHWQVRRTLIGGGGQSTIVFAPEILP